MKKVLIMSVVFLACFTLFSENIRIHVGNEILSLNPNFAELIEKAVREAGFDPEIIPPMPPARGEVLMKRGELDIEFRIPSYGDTNPVVVPIRIPLLSLRMRAFVNNRLRAGTLADLSVKKFASVRGLALNQVIMQKIPDTRLSALVDFDAVLQFVSSGRGDFFVHQAEVGQSLIEKFNFTDKITMIDEVLLNIPVFAFVHNSKSSVISDLEPVLKRMTENGEFEYY